MRNPRLLVGVFLLLVPAMVWRGPALAASSDSRVQSPIQGQGDLAEGEAREAQGDHAAALMAFTKAINAGTLPPAEQGRALFERGLVLDQTGRLQDAAGDYGAALKLTPGFAPALNNRANVWRRLGRLEDAKRDYVASLAAGNSQTQYPYYGLGQIAEAQNQSQAAKGFYARAVAADPGYGLAAERLAALGGPPQDIIHLRPPHGAENASAPLVLRPPKPQPIKSTKTVSPAQDSLGLRPAIIEGKGPRGGPNDNQRGQVQLGAWRSHQEAEAGWTKAQTRGGALLAGLSPHIVTADLPAGRFYRLRLPAAAPGALCAALKAKGQDCIPARD